MTAATVTCPHCGRTLDMRGGHVHLDSCIARPGARDLVRSLMQSDNPGHAVGGDAYGERAAAHNAALEPGGLRAPSQRTLEENFGSWRAACEWAGLERSRKVGGVTNGVNFDDIAAGVEMEKRAAGAILQAERDGERGMAVCSVREIDGGRRVAYVLR